MGWSFNLHGGIAAGLSALLLILAALTWLPGTLPPADSTWLSFRCLPGAVQGVLGGLVAGRTIAESFRPGAWRVLALDTAEPDERLQRF